MDRGTRKGESWIHPPGGGSGFQKELIAAPERVDRFNFGWIVEPHWVDRGTRKGETRIHPPGGGAESEKEWIAEPEKGSSKFQKR